MNRKSYISLRARKLKSYATQTLEEVLRYMGRRTDLQLDIPSITMELDLADIPLCERQIESERRVAQYDAQKNVIELNPARIEMPNPSQRDSNFELNSHYPIISLEFAISHESGHLLCAQVKRQSKIKFPLFDSKNNSLSCTLVEEGIAEYIRRDYLQEHMNFDFPEDTILRMPYRKFLWFAYACMKPHLDSLSTNDLSRIFLAGDIPINESTTFEEFSRNLSSRLNGPNSLLRLKN